MDYSKTQGIISHPLFVVMSPLSAHPSLFCCKVVEVRYHRPFVDSSLVISISRKPPPFFVRFTTAHASFPQFNLILAVLSALELKQSRFLKLSIFFKEFIGYIFWVAISYLFAQKFSPSLFK